ncbi:MAG TPA: ABC transporter substrate-binding protein [Woeseiaceae bacterium]|nr:ABC transporter substrate-binding protein [Woeseiaceae bacterium]
MEGRLLFCLFGLLAFGGAGAADWDGRLHVAMNSDIRSTNPGVKRDANTDTVLHHVVEALVAYDDELNVAPMLASRYEIADDGRTYIFDLRRGVRFHNGEEMTSAHVKWSWQRYLDPATGWRCRSWYDGTGPVSVRILSIETPSRYRVVFRLERPSYIFLHRMAHLQCITAVLHPSSVNDDGEWLRPVATGPYRLEEWRRGEYVELERFEGYRPRPEPRSGLTGRKIALAEAIRFRIVPDAAIAQAALQAGDVDVAISLPISHYEELARADRLEVVMQPTLGWMTLLIQTNDPLLRNPLVRRAIAHAIDRDALAKFATKGFGVANSSAVPTYSPYYRAAFERWHPYDPEKARELLRRAGYGGEEIRIQTNRKHLHLYENAIVMHAMLREAGFNAKLEVLDWASQLNNFYTGNFQLSSFDFSARTEPFLGYGLVTRQRGTEHPWGWDNPRATDLMRRLDSVFSIEERGRIFEKLHELLRADVPVIGLYNLHKMVVLRESLCGFEGWRLEKPRFWGVTGDCPRGAGEAE